MRRSGKYNFLRVRENRRTLKCVFKALMGGRHSTQFRRRRGERDGNKQGCLIWSRVFPPSLFQAVFFFFFFLWWLLCPDRLRLGWWAGWWWPFVYLVLAFADGKRHEYIHDANVFLQVNCITWPGIFHQCLLFPLSCKLLPSCKNLTGHKQVYLWVKI